MDIVEYQLSDNPQVASLFREIFKESGWQEEPRDHMDEAHLLFHIPDGGFLLLGKENNHVIATGGVIFLSVTEGLIKRFYVQKDYRGTGLAQKLLQEIFAKAKTVGLKQLVLDVSKTNTRAIKFYEKSGFIPITIAPRDGWQESNEQDTHLFFSKNI